MQSNSLPKWSKFMKKIACVQPTSAAAERMLKGLYDDTQSCVLEDHQASALMVHYNEGQRRRLLPECCLTAEMSTLSKASLSQ